MNEAREPGHQVSHLDLVPLPSAPYWARRQTSVALSAWQLPAETIQTAQLPVSEIITNALQTARQPAHLASSSPDDGQRIGLTLRLLAGRVVIEVSDNDPHPPHLAHAGTDAESGRGLMLVDALAKEWSYYSPPSAAGGKVVYCVLCAPDDATQDSQPAALTYDAETTPQE